MGEICILNNIGFALKKVNASLFSNSEPHKDLGNTYWEKVRSLLEQIPHDFDWHTTKLKDLYSLFKSQHESKSKLKLWQDVHLNNKRYKNYFTNHERQTSYLVYNDAYQFGLFFRRTSTFTDIDTWFSHNCKLCNGLEDSMRHLLNPDCVVMKQVFSTAKLVFKFITKKEIVFDHDMLFRNQVAGIHNFKTNSADFKVALCKLKMASILRRVIIEEKQKLDKYKIFIPWHKRQDFVNKLISKVRSSFLFFFNHLFTS